MNERELATALGWASLGLGVPQTVAPGRFAEAIGLDSNRRTRAIVRLACGLRELAAAGGVLVLERPRPVRAMWARVAGDALDLALLATALSAQPKDARRTAAAIAAVAGVTAADVLAAVRLSRTPPEPTVEARAAITIRRPPEDVYAFWHDFANLPSFMFHLESVKLGTNGRSHWKAKAPLGHVEWDAEIVEEHPDELIAWRSLPGSDVENFGSVRFRPAPADRGTEVFVELSYAAPGGPAGAAVAKLFGEEPRQQLKDDLRRFKQVMETGEVVRSEGSPEGQNARRHLKQRPAQPQEANQS